MPGSPTFYIGGVECAHRMPGGRIAATEASPAEGPQVSIPIKCAWDDRWSLVKALRGTCTLNPDGLTFTRSAPYALTDNPRLVCVSTGAFEYIGSAVDSAGNLANPNGYAVVPANFSPVPWQFDDGDPSGQRDASGEAWTVTKIKPSAEVYQPPGGSYWLGTFPSTTPLDEASIGFLRANVEIQVTRKFHALMNLGAICDSLGCVNSTTMQFGDKTFDGDGGGSDPTGGTLLLIAAEASEPYFDCLGNPVMDINYTFLGRTVAGWNQVQDRTGAWVAVNSKADGTGDPPFPSFDFTTLPR